jgi:hypothetical protein
MKILKIINMDSTKKLISSIENNIPIIFAKFGDGEYLCVTQNFYYYGKFENHNCDKDVYTEKLSNCLRQSFITIAETCNNYMFGKWHKNEKICNYFSSLTKKSINWVLYDTIIFSPNDLTNANFLITKINLYKTIKNSTRKKIIVCNDLLIKSQLLLNIDNIVIVPLRNWFDEKYEDIKNQIITIISQSTDDFILITCCGMSAKVLIGDLYTTFPNGIYLDFGSGLDLICTKKVSREPLFTYEYLCHLFMNNGLIDETWYDEKYNYIYEKATQNLGIHL